jgi:hypothetical protein
VRLLYVSAAPVGGLELQAGGFAPIRGESSEITTYDNDAYMMGERAILKRPDWLFFDELSVTAGFIGDLEQPNVFDRFDGLAEHNYTQVLVGKRLGGRLTVSADWTSLFGISTIRNAARLQVPEARMVDGVRFEHYARLEGEEAYGFAVTLEKRLNRGIVLSGGYSDVDRFYGPLLGDRYGPGHKLFTTTRFTLTPHWGAQVFYGHAIDNDFPVSSAQRFDIVLTFSALRPVASRSEKRQPRPGRGARRRGPTLRTARRFDGE